MRDQKTYKVDPDVFRRNLLDYTRKAFYMIPEIEKPRILDVGCGSGIPTIELAKLSGGQVIGIDNDQDMLDKLDQECQKMGLSDRIQTMNCSVKEMIFDDESFDIIWAEGSIFAIGFEKGLKEFARLLKPEGYLAVHDELRGYRIKLELIADYGYKLIGYFILPKEIWKEQYYGPMKKQLDALRLRINSETEYSSDFSHYQREVNDFERNPDVFESIFFVMQKF